VFNTHRSACGSSGQSLVSVLTFSTVNHWSERRQMKERKWKEKIGGKQGRVGKIREPGRRWWLNVAGSQPSPGFIPDDGGSTQLWNVGRQSFYTAVHPRRQFWTSYSPPWELEISLTELYSLQLRLLLKKNYFGVNLIICNILIIIIFKSYLISPEFLWRHLPEAVARTSVTLIWLGLSPLLVLTRSAENWI
jgi:hypothetical protein